MTDLSRRGVLAGGLALAGAGLLPGRAGAASVVQAMAPGFEAVVAPDARLDTLYSDGRWCEGPCWVPRLGGLVFSDTRLNRMSLLRDGGRAEPYRDPSNNANGSCLDAQGRLVTCEHRTRRVVREREDGSIEVLADRFEGKRLNAPNDCALGPDGAIWFTDPVFGIRQPDEGLMAEPEQAMRRVYRIAPDGRVEARVEDMDQPNGLAFAPDGRTLFVADAGGGLNPEGPREIRVYSVTPDGGVEAGRVFARLESGVPDGLETDADGRLYAACEDGVRVFAPDCTLLGRIATPTTPANMTFGGPDGRRLFITAGKAVHAITTRARGRGF
ncbi:SMP-30/gluconolactonase/LRE family protein [Antarcticirhabdus aurantiaca]|uniref:SMP-30/gluconolactonase/LRE family protein n=1 Tax=Antarcticirhabdus aurantiaca TaxID=2606717 RepID=A0ACD4NR16_9HYPH|nr:SMP-30/gluconolactonase/LRE family protein [Antarcticirhabdus aurantiaca]WAJ29188.1 SMP-30/gluconolactonase/LRE family protein [Jeongeuplla avenae]